MTLALRLALALIRVLSSVVPSSRRGTWLAQWRGDLWHYDRWLASQSLSSVARNAALLSRAGGAPVHAVTLRIDDWSLRMFSHDLRFAWRMLVRPPAFTAVAMLILGLGIGANATIFSWVEAVVLRPVPGVESSAFLALHGSTPTRDDLSFSYLNLLDLQAARPDGITGLIGFRGVAINMSATGEARRVWGQLVTPNFFDVLGIRPPIGRGFAASDAPAPGSGAAVVLSHHAWTRDFASDPAVVGRSITLNARPFTIIGVAPDGFRGTMSGLAMDLFVPITMQTAFMSGDRLGQRGNSFLQVFARLAPGASQARAQAALDVVAARLAKDHAENEGRGIVSEPLWRDGAAGLMLPVMATLMGVVAVVLLVVCANLAGLLLARAAGRQRDVAVRLALGASRGRLLRQFLLESLLLALGGGVVGITLATWTSGLLTAMMPPTPFPVAIEPGISRGVLLFTLIVTSLTVLGFGLLPALRASRPDLNSTLKDAAAAAGGGALRGRMRAALVVGQVALSVLLLVCAALFGRGLGEARTLDPGFDLRDGAIAALDLLPNGYDAARGTVFHRTLMERVSALPEVRSATVAQAMPLDISAGSDMAVRIDGYQPQPGEEIHAYYNRVAPRYFETMGIRIVAGRALGARDTAAGARAVVINESMARAYWSGQDPVGRTINYGSGPATVVGVAADGKYNRLNEAPRNYIYLSLAQSFRHDALLIVRTDGDPARVMAALRREVAQLDRDVPLFDLRSVREPCS